MKPILRILSVLILYSGQLTARPFLSIQGLTRGIVATTSLTAFSAARITSNRLYANTTLRKDVLNYSNPSETPAHTSSGLQKNLIASSLADFDQQFSPVLAYLSHHIYGTKMDRPPTELGNLKFVEINGKLYKFRPEEYIEYSNQKAQFYSVWVGNTFQSGPTFRSLIFRGTANISNWGYNVSELIPAWLGRTGCYSVESGLSIAFIYWSLTTVGGVPSAIAAVGAQAVKWAAVNWKNHQKNTISAWANEKIAEHRALVGSPLFIAGHSLGGYWAQEFALAQSLSGASFDAPGLGFASSIKDQQIRERFLANDNSFVDHVVRFSVGDIGRNRFGDKSHVSSLFNDPKYPTLYSYEDAPLYHLKFRHGMRNLLKAVLSRNQNFDEQKESIYVCPKIDCPLNPQKAIQELTQ